MTSTFRHSFSKLNFDFDMSNRSLVQIHKDSYSNFLFSKDNCGPSIREVLSSIFPIHDSYGYISMEFVDYRVSKPTFSIEECRTKSLTYASDIFVTFRIVLFSVDETTGIRSIKAIKEQEVYLCSMPLITNNASFVINGIDRIVVCQIHKSPGLFFSRKIKDNKNIAYSATIIPYRGSRLEITFDTRTTMNFRVDKKKKLSIYHLLNCLELSHSEIISHFYDPLEIVRLKNNKAAELWQIKINLESLVGIAPSFDLRNENGEVVFSKDTIISRLAIKNYTKNNTNQSDFYCNIHDLEGKVIHENIECETASFLTPTVLNSSIIEIIQRSSIDAFKIINEHKKTYNSCILDALMSNSDINQEKSLFTLMKILRPGEPFVLKEAKIHFNDLFFESSYYNLFAVGRYKLNKALSLDIDPSHITLTKQDIILSIKKLIELKQLNAITEDVDHLGNRRVRSVGELVENQFRIGVTRVAKYAIEKLNSLILDTATPGDFITSSPVSKSIKEFFMLSELSQFMEQTNLLSELAHGRKISSLGSGGITRDRASSEVRDIHPTHYGRICPIETPDGQNIGLITSLASYAVINKYGFIETPYRKVNESTITDQIEYLDASDEMEHKIAQVSGDIVSGNKITAELVAARYQGDFVMSPKQEISYVDVGFKQIISVVSSLIPFLESNDTGRALMGCNMQRQAVPLLVTEAPYVGTGMEAVVVKESSAVIIAKSNGVVSMVDGEMIIVTRDEEVGVNSNPDSFGKQSCVDVYHLKKFQRSNQSTCFNQRSLVKINQRVSKGDIIADGPATSKGEIALGKNLLVAFMPWNGYNYEDSVVVSQRIIAEDKFTSLHIEEFEIVARDTRLGAEEITRDISGVQENELRYLDEAGIIHIGVNVKAGDILVGKVTPKSETPITSEEKLLRAIFGEKISEVKDSSLRVPPGVYGTVVDVKILTRRGNLKDYRALQIERETVAKRRRQKEHELQIIYSFFNVRLDNLLEGLTIKSNGKKITLQDLSNISLNDKMNINLEESDALRELLEIKNEYLTIIKKIEEEFVKDVEKIMDGDNLPNGVLKIVKVYVATKSRLQPGDKIAGRHGNKGVISVAMPVEDMPFMQDGTPVDLVFSSISVPGRMNIGQVLETHLGFLSHGIGRKIDDMLMNKNAADKVKLFLTEISTDSRFKDYISSMSDTQMLDFAESARCGINFSTPVFDGAKVSEIEQMCEKAGLQKSCQVDLYDGRTGEKFARPVTVGYMYIMKLHHLVDGKMHARSTGPYSLITQQPLGGKSHFGGQRLGEMECWALQAYGAAYTLQEMLTVKSDDVIGRKKMYESIINGETKFYSGIPESFNVLCKELYSLGFDLEFGN
jgi:DNA-directed RNA polymerase subunit beta